MDLTNANEGLNWEQWIRQCVSQASHQDLAVSMGGMRKLQAIGSLVEALLESCDHDDDILTEAFEDYEEAVKD